MNSLIEIYRELPDSGKAELPDRVTPSGFGHEMSELSQSRAPVAHELGTQCSSKETPMIQTSLGQDRFAIFVSTNISRESWDSIGTSMDAPCVETYICSQKAKRVGLDRSLPPTPICESPQASPFMAKYHICFSIGKRLETMVGEANLVRSICGTIDQVPSNAPRSESDNDPLSQGLSRLSYASMDMEIVIPPGLSAAEIVTPLNIRKETRGSRRAFF